MIASRVAPGHASERDNGQREPLEVIRCDSTVVMEFRILGPLQVLRDGVPLVLGGTLQRSVLARLLLDDGRVVRAETLIDDVWAGRPPPTAGKTLQKYISGLRKIIGRSTLRTVAGGYAVDVAGDVLDSRRFEEYVAAGAFADAIALWRGDVLADLPECGFAMPERRRLEDLYLVAVEGRMRDELAGGRHAEAVGDLEVLVAAHPLRERLVAMHMLALYRSGRPVEAVRAYERHRRRLAEDVGMVPASELRELEAAMLRQDPALELDVAPPAATTASRAGRTPATPRSPMPLPRVVERHGERPFVGRDAALHVLRESWQAAVTGDRRLVAITGEDGIGKTRLAARFAADAHDDGAIVLWGRATPGPIVPYEPIVGALRTALRAVSAAARRRVVDGRPALGVLIPDLDDIVPGAESMEPADGMERFVIYETIAELLEAESDSWPILFVIDDLQWADEGSLRLLDHVLRHERPARLLLVATLRTLPTIAAPGVDGFLADLHRDGVLTRLELDGLETVGVTELLEASGWHDARAVADSICRATGGNPFFVTELAEHGQRGPAIELPSSLRDALHRRLDRLDSNTNRLAAVAALAGPAIPLPVLAEAAALPDDQLLDAIDHGRAAGVLVEDVTAGGIGFRHSLVQQAAIERLSRSRRATLHLTLARVLASSEGRRPADLAHHLLASGVLAPADETAEAVVAAGRGALEVLAYEEAARWASSALGITGAAGQLRCESLLLQSDALRALGRRVDARDVARQAASLARELKDPLLLARAAEAVALARAGLGFDFGTCDPELDLLLEEALAALPAASTDYRARLLGASLANAAADGDRAAVMRLARTATRLDGDTDQPALVATAQLAWRMANWRRDLLDDRLAANTAARNNAATRRQHCTGAQRPPVRPHRSDGGRQDGRGRRLVRGVPHAGGAPAPTRL